MINGISSCAHYDKPGQFIQHSLAQKSRVISPLAESPHENHLRIDVQTGGNHVQRFKKESLCLVEQLWAVAIIAARDVIHPDDDVPTTICNPVERRKSRAAAKPGVAEHPKFENLECSGEDLREYEPEIAWDRLHLGFLLKAYRDFPDREAFFSPYFDKLAGSSRLREQILSGWSEDEIRASWQEALDVYLEMREKYLIYD